MFMTLAVAIPIAAFLHYVVTNNPVRYLMCLFLLLWGAFPIFLIQHISPDAAFGLCIGAIMGIRGKEKTRKD